MPPPAGMPPIPGLPPVPPPPGGLPGPGDPAAAMHASQQGVAPPE